MTHGKPCVKMHVLLRHIASHVSTCKGFELCINRGGSQLVYGKREQEERRERGKEKRKREKKENKGKGKEREKEERGGQFLPQYIGVPTVGTR